MRKVTKLLSTTAVVSTLVVGSSATYFSTITNDVQAAEQVQKWGNGEGGSSGGESMDSQSVSKLQSQTPWYKYEGYTTYDPTFTLDYNFVRAMKYDNATINGYKVDPKAYKDYAYSKTIYDTTIDFNDKDEVIQMSFKTKPKSVTKSEFIKAHESNMDKDDDASELEDETMVPFYTNNGGSYKGFFDEDGYLTKIIIGQ
ncbi:immunodominant staphylococcal antigen IsaB family protein [Staphylococcus cohnii]